MENYAYDFGLIIKKLREELGYTQEYMASHLGMTQAGYSGYENNTRTPTQDKIVEISLLLKTTTDHLLGLQKKKPIIVDNLNDEQILAVRQIIKVLEDSNRK